MTSFVLDIDGYKTVSGDFEIQPEIPCPPFWRVNHDKTIWRIGLPEVNRIIPDHSVVLNEEAQWLWRNLNPHISNEQWRALLDNNLALTNGTGFPGHADYINGKDLDMPDPRFDQARVFGGYILKEKYVVGNNMFFEAINVDRPLPTLEYLLDHPWLYGEAVNINQDANKNPVVRLLKGLWGVRVYAPLFVSLDYPYFHIVPEGTEQHSGLTRLPDCSPFPDPHEYP